MKFKDLVAGLNVLMKYNSEVEYDSDFWSANHDEATFPGPSPEYMTESECMYLEELGFTYDEEYESWHVFS